MQGILIIFVSLVVVIKYLLKVKAGFLNAQCLTQFLPIRHEELCRNQYIDFALANYANNIPAGISI